jgi:hypothetical protein
MYLSEKLFIFAKNFHMKTFYNFILLHIASPIFKLGRNVFVFFKNSKTARILLLIVIIKFSIFYGFFKSYLFPRYLKPKWETEEHRINEVTRTIINQQNTE